MRRTIALPLVLALGCGGGEPADDAAPAEFGSAAPRPAPTPSPTPAAPGAVEGVEVELVGSVPWETELASGEYRRVVVTVDGAADTLDGVAVTEPPVVAGDSTLHGFDRADGTVERGFVWRRGEGVTGVDLPDDHPGFTAIGLAPDGAHVAYVGIGADAPSGARRLKAVVRTWPALEPVAESGPVAGYPSDGPNSAVTWTAADSVEVRIRLDDLDADGGAWLRFRGSAASGAFSADTVRGG